MVDITLGLFSALILIGFFSKIERKRVPKIGKTKYIFLLIILFSSFLISPSENLIEWIIWLMFFYTVLDDINTKTVFVPIYFAMVLVIFVNGHTLKEFLLALLIFLIFLIIAKKTKETFFCIGDAYAILALAFWFNESILIAIILSIFLVSAILPVVDFFLKSKYYPYTPFLGISVVIITENWYVYEIFTISFLLNIFFLSLNRIIKK